MKNMKTFLSIFKNEQLQECTECIILNTTDG